MESNDKSQQVTDEQSSNNANLTTSIRNNNVKILTTES